MIQSCPEASPVKWHQAHTTWFFETFVLQPFLAGYEPFREDFQRLFKSYCVSRGEEIPEKKLRSYFSRPALDEVLAFRSYVDDAMDRLLERSVDPEVCRRVLLGVNHEQQHQEMLLADVKFAFYANPLRPAYAPGSLAKERHRQIPRLRWLKFEGGQAEIGHSPDKEDPLGFCFENETPRHKVYLEPYQIANREVTCREYVEFISDNGYARPGLWLADGWERIRREGWEAPLYWERDSGDERGWRIFTLRGSHPLAALLDTPVCHLSFFEADAFARWRGCRLPTEAEWESVAKELQPRGNLLDTGRLHPARASSDGTEQFFGDCWEWSSSAHTFYPGYKTSPNSLGEYSGKLMSGQMVLRGGSCATPAGHVRASCRNFSSPATRRQFTGIRLAT
jgi:ergothioneine biosynthesis protein EgtB